MPLLPAVGVAVVKAMVDREPGRFAAFAALFGPFVALYAALFIAFGAFSPFQPALLAQRGLHPEMLSFTLAAGTAVRVLAGPAAGRLADRLAAPRAILCSVTLLAAVAALAYLPLRQPWALLFVAVLQAAALAPVVPIADTLSLAASTPPERSAGGFKGFDYGWVRGVGSAAFILGVTAAGGIIGRFGYSAILFLNAAMLALGAAIAAQVPNRLGRHAPPNRLLRHQATGAGIAALLRMPVFRRLLLVAALVLGSHAMHDSFGVIRWQAIGISSSTAGLLWSEGVFAEIVVFLFVGRLALARLGPASSASLAAAAGVVRWAVMARATSVTPIALTEPLHGLTFALLHLACMDVIRATVPPHLAATAQTVYGTLVVGASTSILTLCSGVLYAHLGGGGFWFMGALCGLAVPLSRGMKLSESPAATREPGSDPL
jgi:MFS transporter, PPP family, 3-phenylpropionic acid transporter